MMQCPICNKELVIKKKKVGETENGEAIYHKYAVCHDCKKQWNLEKQRAKKNIAAAEEAPKSDAIDNTEKKQTYSNIPPQHIREAREREMRANYQNMLDEGAEEEEDCSYTVLVVILVILILIALAFAGYWFLLK